MRVLAVWIIAAGLGAAEAAKYEPPVRDHVSLAAVTLNRLTLAPAKDIPQALLPPKANQLPNSVRHFLKPSGQLNSLSLPVQKAAAAVRRALAPGKAQEKALRDAGKVAEAVEAYLAERLTGTAALDDGIKPATDHRLAWPAASAILTRGSADAQGRELVRVAILRALKVPARTCWAGGRLRTQYWQPLKGEAVKSVVKGKKGKRTVTNQGVLGRWEVAGGLKEGETVDAWSLDPGTLARLRWEPAQELSVREEAFERWYFPEEMEIDAKAALGLAAKSGRMPPGHPGAASPEGFFAASPSASVLALTIWRVRLEAEGAMAAMEPVDLLSPYQPHLGSWKHEAPPRFKEMNVEEAALWCDRPERLKLRQGKPVDEWASPPPALGVVHHLSCGLRRPGSVLAASWSGGRVEGKILRADNLTPRAQWPLWLEAKGLSWTAQSLTSADDGSFSVELSEAQRSAPALRLGEEKLEAAKPKSESLWLWPTFPFSEAPASLSVTPTP